MPGQRLRAAILAEEMHSHRQPGRSSVPLAAEIRDAVFSWTARRTPTNEGAVMSESTTSTAKAAVASGSREESSVPESPSRVAWGNRPDVRVGAHLRRGIRLARLPAPEAASARRSEGRNRRGPDLGPLARTDARRRAQLLEPVIMHASFNRFGDTLTNTDHLSGDPLLVTPGGLVGIALILATVVTAHAFGRKRGERSATPTPVAAPHRAAS
jgi:hypothetical protein